MTWNETGGRLGAEFFTPGGSSFTEFLAVHRPELLSTRGLLPEGVVAAPDQVPHGTTVLALTYRDGVLIAGDRRATMGNIIAQRDLEKVHPADDHTAVAFAGSVGLALDMVKLYQVELTHFEKIEGTPMTLNAKATRLANTVRQNLGQAMQGLAMVPLLVGYDVTAPEGQKGRIFGYDVTGGPYEKTDFHAEGSGSPYARGALKKLFRKDMTRREAALAALQALYDAADDDSATGGPDIGRRIFPIVSVITEDGFERLTEEATEELCREMIEQREGQPDGPVATL
ncbi:MULTISPECIES: proteasome subunit beta [unclassified Streptomyces]|uniref:proteasome subunit beta n=1 Tax=unclassified Streptomyces TaxID=2593676 RepID=UPI001F03EB06|nr:MULTISPECIES: proteasome subunit beta [unclassified Streptomyces]MCH0564874.1 proteasome subunit beta [Streptomyces sp. MUM 2J]MCH0569852.1 proteasome subunit beta [Streptomyces sp. MUM 136J]